jgi:MEMO1 family protein
VTRFTPDQPIRLRAVEITPYDHQGPAFLLRDPLGLAQGALVVPRGIAPLLALLDGGMTYAELHTLVARDVGAVSGPALLNQLLDALDVAFLLANDSFAEAYEQARRNYRAAPHRPAMLAGVSYPSDPRELRRSLDGLLDAAGEIELSPPTSRAILSPHIDYARGGPVYAQVWKSAAAAARQAELVVLLATDHKSPAPLTLTQQRYATPYGALATDQEVVGTLADAIGPGAFASELYHQIEHSVELVVTWLHHIRDAAPCAVVPILCGSFFPYTHSNAQPEESAELRGCVQALRQIAEQRRTLFIISGDLAHVGPAFDDPPLDADGERQLRQDDQDVLDRLTAADPDGLLRVIRHVQDRNKICGLPPAYLALSASGASAGEQYGYLRCPADEQDRSAVTVAGFVFS